MTLEEVMFEEHTLKVLDLANLAAGRGVKTFLANGDSEPFLEAIDDLRAELICGSVHTSIERVLNEAPTWFGEDRAVGGKTFWPVFRVLVEMATAPTIIPEVMAEQMLRLRELLIPWLQAATQEIERRKERGEES
jgi:hypothetical protein